MDMKDEENTLSKPLIGDESNNDTKENADAASVVAEETEPKTTTTTTTKLMDDNKENDDEDSIQMVSITDETPTKEQVKPMIEVTSPATLSAGQTFQAETTLGAFPLRFTVTVPPGGVTEGQTFLVSMPLPSEQDKLLQVPKGQWKDGLFNFLKYGVFHPHWILAVFNPTTGILLGQVRERLKLKFFKKPGDEVKKGRVFAVFVGTWVFLYLLMLSVAWSVAGISVMGTIVAIYIHYNTVRARQTIREEFNIPQQYIKGRCAPCEDFLCGLFCNCCTVAQMARHTGEYENYKGRFLTSNGLEPSAPHYCV